MRGLAVTAIRLIDADDHRTFSIVSATTGSKGAAMMRRLVLILVSCVLLSDIGAQPSLALETGTSAAAVWSAIIPDGFPGFVYTWQMKDDGSYREDGRDGASGKPIQPTLSGRWSRDGSRMLLKQEGQPFVFDGVVLGGLYTGTLYLHGRAYSRFCAQTGDVAPKRCDTAPGVAMRPRAFADAR
jgi:hypothetical protein